MTRGTTTPTETMTALIKPTCEGKGLQSRQTLCATGGRARLVISQCVARGRIGTSLQFTDRRRAEDLANQLYTQHAVTSVHVS